MNDLYTIENAQKFNWSSISGDLNPERVQHLENYLVGETILDAGCGGGAYVEFLARKGFTVTGIDKHEEFLNYIKDENKLGTYLQGDITRLPFPDKSFDCTYCFDVLEHVDDVLAIRELARVTKKRILFTVPQMDQLMQQFGLLLYPYQDPTHLRYYTTETIECLVETITYSSLQILCEGRVPLGSLFSQLLDDVEANYPRWILRESYRVRTKQPLVNKIVWRVIDYLINLLIDRKRLSIVFKGYLGNSNLYKTVNLGLVAIVDLDDFS